MSTKDEPTTEDASFDRIMEIVGNDGRYQKLFNFLFGFCLLVAVMMPTLNIIMVMAVPKHWCHIPGREKTNLTLEQWKEITIPKENTSQGIYTFSSCKMYDIFNESAITDCQFGWEYDQTWYTRTAVTQENWVCDKELHVTNTFVFTKIGDFLGTFMFGQIADLIGRRPAFFITIVILFLGRLMSTFTSGYIWIFAVAAMIGNLATPSVFQSPLTIAMEISKIENRAFVQLMQALGSTIGMCALPIIFWIFRDWIPFMLLTTLPCGLYLFTFKWIVESPRWLASRRKTKQCIKELSKIANFNKNTITDEVTIILNKNRHVEETTYGFMSLFVNSALVKKTISLTIIFIVINTLYFTLIMNINNLEGNPFLNYFLQGLAELPACVLGKYFCDKMGRLWSHRYGLIITAVCSILMVFLIKSEFVLMSTIVVVLLKLFTTLSFYAINLHMIEIFPTCVRQTGIAFCTVTASFVSTLSPYIIYLGTTINLIYPYMILAGLATLGVICGLFLSETLNKKLPETLEDAKEGDKYKSASKY